MVTQETVLFAQVKEYLKNQHVTLFGQLKQWTQFAMGFRVYDIYGVK